MNRYANLFSKLRSEERIAFIPFLQVGDPTPDASFRAVMALVDAGADALELGIPFSDPIADGPTIQAAAQRAIRAGTTPSVAMEIIARVRAARPEVPIGLLVYANLVAHDGLDRFYGAAGRAGVDSVLVADVPTIEAGPYASAARRYGVEPVFIAPPNAPPTTLRRAARLGSGYTYVVTRKGVTGAEDRADIDHGALLRRLEEVGAPPPVLGFGISEPAQVADARAAGAAGVISGSAVVDRLHRGGIDAAAAFVSTMAKATRPL